MNNFEARVSAALRNKSVSAPQASWVEGDRACPTPTSSPDIRGWRCRSRGSCQRPTSGPWPHDAGDALTCEMCRSSPATRIGEPEAGVAGCAFGQGRGQHRSGDVVVVVNLGRFLAGVRP